MTRREKVRVLLIAGLFLLVSSCEGAMAHSAPKEKPDKPVVEKPTPPVEVVPQSIEPRTQEPRIEHEVCGRDPQPRECRRQDNRPTARPRSIPAPVIVDVIRPSVITPHVTRDAGSYVLRFIFGTPKVSTYSVCRERGLALTCRAK